MKTKKRKFSVVNQNAGLKDGFFVEIFGFFSDWESDEPDQRICTFGPFFSPQDTEMIQLLDLLDHLNSYTLGSSKEAQKAYNKFFIEKNPLKLSEFFKGEDYSDLEITHYEIKKFFNGVDFDVNAIVED